MFDRKKSQNSTGAQNKNVIAPNWANRMWKFPQANQPASIEFNNNSNAALTQPQIVHAPLIQSGFHTDQLASAQFLAWWQISYLKPRRTITQSTQWKYWLRLEREDFFYVVVAVVVVVWVNEWSRRTKRKHRQSRWLFRLNWNQHEVVQFFVKYFLKKKTMKNKAR